MTVFQSKLSKDEKANVREMITDFENFGGRLFYFPNIGLTMAIAREFQGAKMAKIGMSWQSETEKKFRKLVGAMNAIERVDYNFVVPVAFGEEADFAGNFAEMCAAFAAFSIQR